MTNITVLIREDKSIILFFRMDRQFLMEYLRRLRRRRKICLRQSILYLDLCAAAPGRFFACAGDLPQISHGFHPGFYSEQNPRLLWSSREHITHVSAYHLSVSLFVLLVLSSKSKHGTKKKAKNNREKSKRKPLPI